MDIAASTLNQFVVDFWQGFDANQKKLLTFYLLNAMACQLTQKYKLALSCLHQALKIVKSLQKLDPN